MWGIMNREFGEYRKSSLKAILAASLLIVLIFVLVGQALYALPAAAQDQELLENGGFEQGESHWGEYCGTFVISSDYVHQGNYAAKFTLNPNRLEGWIYQDVYRDSFVPGETYNLIGYYAAQSDPNIERIFLRIRWYDEGGNELPEHQQEASSSMTSDDLIYCLLSIPHPPDVPDPVLAPLNAHRARIEAGVRQRYVTKQATAYFDDLSFSGPKPPITINLEESLTLVADVNLAADLNLVADSSEAETNNGQMSEEATSPISTPGQSLLAVVLVSTLAFMGVVCLILGFWLKRRG